MKSRALVRLFAVGLISALILSLISLFSLNKVLDYATSNHRRFMMLSIAESIEARPLDPSLFLFSPGRGHRPPPPDFGPPPGPSPFAEGPEAEGRPHRGPHRGPHGPGGPRGPRLNMWVVDEKGQLIATNSALALPGRWRDLKLPQESHEIASDEGFFNLRPAVYVIRLNSRPSAFLIVYEGARPFSGPLFVAQAILTFVTVSLAIFFSLFITFLYLRRKSRDAKAVLRRLEKGDLKARFQIQRLDEFGVLMLDFNRMADEIERLVLRIHETEKSRKNLLQELGHDLRTPLTGLTTAFETLKDHFPKIPPKDREELFNIMGGEISYLRDLLEKLLTIATLDEPHYKKTTESIDLEDLLGQEIKARQSGAKSTAKNRGVNGNDARDVGADQELRWSFKSLLAIPSANTFLGDPHLVLRLLRNGLDNAAKYARHQVVVSLQETHSHYEIHIIDDGPGLSQESQESFGQRRDYRARAVTGLHYSIGLGSVIMKTIAELHGGSVEIQNVKIDEQVHGADLKILLPKVF